MQLVRFMEISAVQVHWQRWNHIGPRQITPAFLETLHHAFNTLWAECPQGRARAILSHGAYVAKGGRHGKGSAFDLTGIMWDGQPPFICGDTYEADDWGRYLAIESAMRRHVPQVLGWDETSGRHRHHWHLDDRPVMGFQPHSHVDVCYAQRCLNFAYNAALVVDGDYGPRTKDAEAEAFFGMCGTVSDCGFEDLGGWHAFLADVAKRAWRERGCG